MDSVGLLSIPLLSSIPLYPTFTIFVYLYTYNLKDLKHKLKVAKHELAEVKGIEYDEIEDMLADFNEIFDACNITVGWGLNLK